MNVLVEEETKWSCAPHKNQNYNLTFVRRSNLRHSACCLKLKKEIKRGYRNIPVSPFGLVMLFLSAGLFKYFLKQMLA